MRNQDTACGMLCGGWLAPMITGEEPARERCMAQQPQIDEVETRTAHARARGRAGQVTRFTFVRRTLLLNFYPVLTVAAGNAILLGVPQAREALGAFRSFG